MKRLLGMAVLLANAMAMTDPFMGYRTGPKVSITPKRNYNLPTWQVGKIKIHAKSASDALKYAKKRGLYDGVSVPARVI